jgi:hypothetical protein
LYNFKFSSQNEEDIQINGTFCYAISYDDYVADCRDPGLKEHNITGDWIVANPFNRTHSNNMIGNATNYTESRIRGLIFISDTDITATHKYPDPKLIGRISSDHDRALQAFTYIAN